MQSFYVASATEANTLCFMSCHQEEISLLVLLLYSEFGKLSTCFLQFLLFLSNNITVHKILTNFPTHFHISHLI